MTSSPKRILETKRGFLEDVLAGKQKLPPGSTQTAAQARAEVLSQLAALPPEVPPQLLADDVTSQAVGDLLAKHGKLFVCSDESMFFEVAMGKWNKGRPDCVTFNQGYDAADLRANRIGRGAVRVSGAPLSVVAALQPSVMAEVVAHKELAGNGFLSRFLFSVPAPVLSEDTDLTPPPPHVVERYRLGMRALWTHHTAHDSFGKPAAAWVLTFSPEARAVLTDFRKWLLPKMDPGGELDWPSQWPGRMAGNLVRIAAVLTVADAWEVGKLAAFDLTVPVGPVERAVRLVRDYFLPHARAAFGVQTETDTRRQARAVVDYLRRQRPREVTRRQLTHDVWALKGKAKELDAVTDLMTDLDYLHPVSDGLRGDRPAKWTVNPLALTTTP